MRCSVCDKELKPSDPHVTKLGSGISTCQKCFLKKIPQKEKEKECVKNV